MAEALKNIPHSTENHDIGASMSHSRGNGEQSLCQTGGNNAVFSGRVSRHSSVHSMTDHYTLRNLKGCREETHPNNALLGMIIEFRGVVSKKVQADVSG